MFNFGELVEDYESYMEALYHREDGDFQNYKWYNPEWAKREIGEELYKQVISSWRAKLEKEMMVYCKKSSIEQDFIDSDQDE